MICQRPDRHGGTYCYSPQACGGFGYCRNRNIEAGGMKNVSADDQAAWRAADNPLPEPVASDT